jgi:hypothetical protein
VPELIIFFNQAKSVMEKSRRAKSYHTRYQNPQLRVPRKSLSTSNLFHFHNSTPQCNFEGKDWQDSQPSMKISPKRQSKTKSLLRRRTEGDQGNSNLTISDFESERGSFSFSDLDPVLEREEADSITIDTEYVS